MKNYIDKFIFALKQVVIASPFILICSVALMIISGICPVIYTYFISKIIGLMEQINMRPVTLSEVIIPLLIIIFSGIFNFFSSSIKMYLSNMLGCQLSHNIENMISDKVQNIPQRIMDTPVFLDLYKNTVDKVGYEPINIICSFFGIVTSLIGLISYFSILVSFNFFAPIILLLFSIPIYYFRKRAKIRYYNFVRSSTMEVRRIWYHFSLMSEKKYSKEVRVYKLFPFLKDRRNILFNKWSSSQKKILFYSIVCIIFSVLVSVIGLAIVEIWIVMSVIHKMVSLSEFILFNSSLFSLEFGFISLADQFISNKESMLFLDFLFEFLKLDMLGKGKKDIEISNSQEYIFEFVNVSFKYPGSEYYCLEDINLKIKTGEIICLIGENGSGKSTLVKLLLRIYEPSSGQILINGVDIKEYTLHSYYSLFGVLFQDYINFSFNVQENIGFGCIDRVNQINDIESIAKKIGIDNFVKKYKNKYKTNLSREFYDDGIEPSMGQWQKLAIARALFSKSAVLVMDEPTSALDPEAEEDVFSSIRTCSKESLVMMISHRMSSAKFSDRIIFLSQGKIVESGTHLQLMKKKGMYFKMYSLQADKYLKSTDMENVL